MSLQYHLPETKSLHSLLSVVLARVRQPRVRFRKKALKRTVCDLAMVFSRAIRLRLVEQDILLAYITDIEWGVKHKSPLQ